MSLLQRLITPKGPQVQSTELGDGTVVHLRRVLEGDYSVYESELFDPKSGTATPERFQSQRRRFLALCLCDEHGNRIVQNYTDLENMDPGEAVFLRNEYDRLFPRPRVRKVDALEKKSDPVLDSDTPSGSA